MGTRVRIAFSGASGTGKTTMCAKLVEEYGMELCPVGSRSVSATMGFSNPYDVDAAGKREEFQEKLFLDKLSWEGPRKSFVTDRTYLDNVAYSLLHVDPRKVNADFLTRAGTAAAHSYDLIFFCPLSSFHELDSDPSRVAESNYHKTFELLLLGLHRAFGTNVIFVSPSDLGERLSFVKRFML